MKATRARLADADAFADKVAKKSGKLSLWEAEIFHLVARNVSYRNIQQFLEDRGTQVTFQGLHKFVHREKRAHLLAKASAARSMASPPAVPRVAADPVATPAAPAAPAMYTPPAPGTLPKFTWDPDSIDMKDLT
jgi:hypothetical protein